MKQKPSFRNALLAALLVAAVVPVFAIGLITLTVEHRNLSDHVGMTNLTLARSVAREVAGSLREPQSFIEHIGKVMGRDDGNAREQARRLLEEVRSIGLFESVYLLDRRGKVADVAFAENVPASPRDYLGMDMSNLPVLRKTLAKGEISRSTVFLSSATGDPAVMFVAPAGEGAVVGTLGLRVLSRIAEQVKPDDGGSVIIVSKFGKIIGHADYSLVHRQTDLGGMEIVRAGLAGKSGTHTYAVDGVERLGSVVRIPETGWLVIVEVPLA
ncbi:histidine kinase, partial [bacterium]|nr:histidine kinase [bacterium]